MQTKIQDPVLAELSRAIRNEVGANLKSIILFGSRARGDFEEWSDYDIIVLVERKTADLEQKLFRITSDVGLKHDTLVSALSYEKSSFDADKYEPLFMNVRREGVPI